MVGCVVKFTEVPEQIELLDAVSVMEGVTEEAVMVIGLLATVLGEAQASELVSTTDTTSPF